jgi:hypothetical protein
MQYVGVGRIGVTQSVAFSATPGAVTNGVSIGVTKVRILVTADAFVTTDGTTPSATNGAYVPGLSPEYFTVTQGQKPAAVEVTASGTMYVNEIS